MPESLRRADGSELEVLVEQFVVEADVEACRPPEEDRWYDPGVSWGHEVSRWVGPSQPTWSPKGDKIAFLAALPFDPHGLPVLLQVEAWIYDLATKQLSRITHDEVTQLTLSWR